jgi:hypothetical protein
MTYNGCDMSLDQERIDNLRREIRNNRISFPAQAPVFQRSRADIQWRLVLLYFIRGWTCKQLSARYGLTRQRIEQLIADWVYSAVTHGYLQEIPADGSGLVLPSVKLVSGRDESASACGAGC